MGIVTAADLRATREALGLTQRQLAERLGVHKMTIYRWESARVPVPAMVALVLPTLRRRGVRV